MPKKVCYLFSRFPVASHTFYAREIIGLEKKGYDITLVSLNPPTNTFQHKFIAEIRGDVIYPPAKRIYSKIKKQIFEANRESAEKYLREYHNKFFHEINWNNRVVNAIYFGKILRQLGINHVHVHFTNQATITAIFIKHFCQIDFSFTAHGKDYLTGLKLEIIQEFVKEAKFCVCVSNYSQNHFKALFPNYSDKIHRVYNGIRINGKSTAKNNDKQIHIVSIGRLVEFKGFDILVRAIASASREAKNIKCTVVGEGELLGDLTNLAKSLKAPVDFVGLKSQEQVNEILQTADIFLLTSRVDSSGSYDMLPTVITEAMNFGLPIVSTKIAGICEMVKNKKNGYLVDFNNVTSIKLALLNLINNKKLRTEFGKNSKKVVKKILDEDKSIKDLDAVFAKYVKPVTKQKYATKGFLEISNLAKSKICDKAELDNLLRKNPSITFISNIFLTNKLHDNLIYYPDEIVMRSKWLNTPDKQIKKAMSKLYSETESEKFSPQAELANYLLDLMQTYNAKSIFFYGMANLETARVLKQSSRTKVGTLIENSSKISRTKFYQTSMELDLLASNSKLASVKLLRKIYLQKFKTTINNFFYA